MSVNPEALGDPPQDADEYLQDANAQDPRSGPGAPAREPAAQESPPTRQKGDPDMSEQNRAGAKQGSMADSDAHPERVQGEPTIIPEANARPTHGDAAGYKPARSLPDEPLKPAD